MNNEWHAEHPEPRQGSLEQKIRWHEEHARACGCTPTPGAIMVELERRERRGNKKKPYRR